MPGSRPQLKDLQTAFKMTMQSGDDRIKAMDVAEIDMQILGPTGLTQQLPRDQAVDLGRQLNDRAAEWCRTSPIAWRASA